MLYQESDLAVIVGGERTVAEGLGAQWVAGLGIKATRRAQVDEVWNHPEEVALPFPFTLKQFAAFCVWHPTFAWEAIHSPFTNDDNTLDEIALSELAERGSDAAKLVRYALNGFVEPSRLETRQVDAGLVNIDRLAQEIARAMGLAKVEFAFTAMTIANAVFAKASRGEIKLYREVIPHPFDMDENESMHGGLRLTIADADALSAFFLAAPSDALALSSNTPAPEQLHATAVQHTTKGRRRDILTPVIEHAQSLCKNPLDTAEVWGQLHTLTAQKHTVLLHLEGDAVVYTDGDNTKKLTRKNLSDRLGTAKKKLVNTV